MRRAHWRALLLAGPSPWAKAEAHAAASPTPRPNFARRHHPRATAMASVPPLGPPPSYRASTVEDGVEVPIIKYPSVRELFAVSPLSKRGFARMPSPK